MVDIVDLLSFWTFKKIVSKRENRTERVTPSLALDWDMWISPKLFLDQLNTRN